jgi:hypothetical protein
VSFGGGSSGGSLPALAVAGQGEDRGVQAGQGAGGPVAAVRAGRLGGDAGADEAENGMSPGSIPAHPAARAAAVAVMLWMSSSAQASWRARSGDWPRKGRRGPRTVFFKCKNAISICHLSAYRTAISAAGNA